MFIERLSPHFQNANVITAINYSKHDWLNPEICFYLTNLQSRVYRVIKFYFIIWEDLITFWSFFTDLLMTDIFSQPEVFKMHIQ